MPQVEIQAKDLAEDKVLVNKVRTNSKWGTGLVLEEVLAGLEVGIRVGVGKTEDGRP